MRGAAGCGSHRRRRVGGGLHRQELPRCRGAAGSSDARDCGGGGCLRGRLRPAWRASDAARRRDGRGGRLRALPRRRRAQHGGPADTAPAQGRHGVHRGRGCEESGAERLLAPARPALRARPVQQPGRRRHGLHRRQRDVHAEIRHDTRERGVDAGGDAAGGGASHAAGGAQVLHRLRPQQPVHRRRRHAGHNLRAGGEGVAAAQRALGRHAGV
mmetsp:Transcript_30978/g.79535  ORF Transcript_30978/g.79535 Transcript_30978/m.79535 type:complete len:214 (+) Transcript_30978:91-732(+)